MGAISWEDLHAMAHSSQPSKAANIELGKDTIITSKLSFFRIQYLMSRRLVITESNFSQLALNTFLKHRTALQATEIQAKKRLFFKHQVPFV